MKASEQYFIAVLLKISYIEGGSKDGIIVIILTNFITSKHAIACSWSADSRERRGVKNERENKGAGAAWNRLITHSSLITWHATIQR